MRTSLRPYRPQQPQMRLFRAPPQLQQWATLPQTVRVEAVDLLSQMLRDAATRRDRKHVAREELS